jgi:hypothetical protein
MMKKSAYQIQRSKKLVGTLLWKKFCQSSLPNCPECTMREKKKIQERYNLETPEEERRKEDLFKQYDEIDIPMKMDEKNRRHFVCKRCGLYATREEVSDIRYRLNQKERTRDDKHDEYLEWWSKSKKDKQED